MIQKAYQHIYGPVSSWRLGASLGIDLLGGRGKHCNFDCLYCQLGRTKRLMSRRKVFVETDEILREIQAIWPISVDFVTFSGSGEPTLAKNLGEVIRGARKLTNKKIAVITNASLIDHEDVQEDLSVASFVLAKLDVSNEESFLKFNRPAKDISLTSIINGLRNFRKSFLGKFAIQIMFTKKNQKEAAALAELVKFINPDEVEINTPLRPSQEMFLAPHELESVRKFFRDEKTKSVYESILEDTEPLEPKKTFKRRGALV